MGPKQIQIEFLEGIAGDRGLHKRHSFSIMGLKKAINMERGLSHILISKGIGRIAEFIEISSPEIPSLVKGLC